jgi:cyanophycinase-like exopeptidase
MPSLRMAIESLLWLEQHRRVGYGARATFALRGTVSGMHHADAGHNVMRVPSSTGLNRLRPNDSRRRTDASNDIDPP